MIQMSGRGFIEEYMSGYIDGFESEIQVMISEPQTTVLPFLCLTDMPSPVAKQIIGQLEGKESGRPPSQVSH